MSDTQNAKNETIEISDSAATRIATLLEEQNDNGLRFRVRVDGGGCNGFQYIFGFDKENPEEDTRFTKNGIDVLVDSVSLQFLNGSELDYIEELIGSYFTVKNPNASSSCGCGTSFSV